MIEDREHRTAGSPGDGAARWVVVLTVVVVLAIHVVGRVGSFCSPVRADSYAYAVVGYRIAQGEDFYGPSLSDVKPPGLYDLYALAYTVLPPGRFSMIPVDTLFGLLGYWAVYLLARDLYGHRVALLMTVVSATAINAFMLLDFATEGFGLAESFMVLPAALAARQYLGGVRRRRVLPLFWCGLWLGADFAVKQTALPLAVAVMLHWTTLALFAPTGFRRWLSGSMAVAGGVMAALIPFVIVIVAQGTWMGALKVLGPPAARMLTLETAWPSQWRNVMPLWVPMAWSIIGLIWRCESSFRNRHQTAGDSDRWSSGQIAFLLIWLACECVMLVFLPLRAFHYYVVASVVLVLLSGVMWTLLAGLGQKVSARVALACLSTAAVLSIAFGRPVLDTMVPIAIARYRSYDPVADRVFFDRLASQDVLNLGVRSDPKPN